LDEFWKTRYGELLRVSERCVGDWASDLLHDLAVWSYENTKGTELCKRGELMYYLLSAIKMAAFSQTTPFFKKYKRMKFDELPIHLCEIETDETDISEQQLQWIQNELKSLKYFDQRVFELYYQEKKSLTSLSYDTGIPRSTIYKSISKTKTQLQAQAKRIRRHG